MGLTVVYGISLLDFEHPSFPLWLEIRSHRPSFFSTRPAKDQLLETSSTVGP